LAYVFWHVPRAGAAAHDYELLHRGFHEVLRESHVRGLTGVRVFRLAAIPWLDGQAGYEDWHLLDGSAALDVLDDAAITGPRLVPHNRIAALAASGTAGLYGLRMGRAIEPAIAYWLSKPEGLSYRAFEATLEPHIETGCCLWGRRLTLGPTLEFCLHAPAPRDLPHPALEIPMHALAREPH
jgi:hypothetical protein